ncbi:MAG TPA: hypothetical protein ENG49_00125 [Candidatus Omnitrophica bacterium]|nr:hypothetical protein [Candidatus Omnitrophota bacterium]
MLIQIKDVENSLPFPLLGFDTDNGSEFLNWHLFRHFTPNPALSLKGRGSGFTQRKNPVQFTKKPSTKSKTTAI